MKRKNHPAQNPVLQTDNASPRLMLMNDPVVMPIRHLPSARTSIAIQNGVANNLLFKVWGGLGDQICSEPTLRYALKTFKKNSAVNLAADNPNMFSHLSFSKVFDLKEVQPNFENFLCFDTIVPSTELIWQFISHCLTNCVDFASMCSLRLQLPIEDKAIYLTGSRPHEKILDKMVGKKCVYVHAGKHWQSKTFPKKWWDDVLGWMITRGLTPVLIGADVKATPGMASDNRTTVDVCTDQCIDLRNKTSIQETIWLLQRARVLITNDSSPLHMAASSEICCEENGRAWIGYIATCKHPDYITHWRHVDHSMVGLPVFQWREENLGLDGIWNHLSNCPNAQEEVSVENVGDELLKSFLPTPESVALWAKEKYDEFF